MFWNQKQKLFNQTSPYNKIKYRTMDLAFGFNSVYLYIYIYILYWNWEKIKLEFQIRISILRMCTKLFILKEFYFLILELNVGSHHKYSYKWVIKYKNQRV